LHTISRSEEERLETKKGVFVTDLINNCWTFNIILNHCSRSERHSLTIERYLSHHNRGDCDPYHYEPRVEFDQEAEAAYKVWQESLAYVRGTLENVP
jgi:hypothetical protein